jgi:tetratricopeptide (TPR) repeat protein
VENCADELVATLQDSLVSRVAAALIPRLNGNRSPMNTLGTTDVNAYEAYLKGRFFTSRPDRQSQTKAVEYLELAVQLDPGYARARWALGDVYNRIGGFGFAPQRVMAPKAKVELQAAIALDPTLAEPWATLGLISHNYDWEGEADRNFKRAIALNPNYVGDLERAFAELDRMCEERTTNVMNLKADPVFDPSLGTAAVTRPR